MKTPFGYSQFVVDQISNHPGRTVIIALMVTAAWLTFVYFKVREMDKEAQAMEQDRGE